MKTYLFLIFFFPGFAGFAQKGEDLLVYSVNGDVMVVENKQESVVKIGKVLRQESTLQTKKGSKLTMVCRQGKALSVINEGSYPMTHWRDSCKVSQQSLTSGYFQYVWSELYVRSPEHKRRVKDGEEQEMVTNAAPFRFEMGPDLDIGIRVEHALDTVNYTIGEFALSWTEFDFPGKHIFMLYQARDGKLIYRKSSSATSVRLSDLKNLLRPGNSYQWLIALKDSGNGQRRLLNCLPFASVKRYIETIRNNINVPEDDAAQFFHIAWLLENSHYLADAFFYYQKAAIAAPDIELYRDKLAAFKKIFLISKE